MLSKEQLNEARHAYENKKDEHVKTLSVQTQCVHAGQDPDLLYGAINVPIFQTTTFQQHGYGLGEFIYTRCGNPTRYALERSLAILHHGTYGIVWGSGMAAVLAILNMLESGDEIVSVNDLYSGTYCLLSDILPKKGLKAKLISFEDASAVLKEVSPTTKMVYMESSTNPSLTVPDIKTIAEGAKKINKDIIVVVDNTFLSPINCTPLDLGADIVIESVTKYLNGHCDVVMGATITKSKEINEKLSYLGINTGGVPSPFDCYLVLRGIKTLSLRVNQINQSALAIAKFLEKHPMVEKVHYPGLESDPYHEVASKQFKGYGGVISFIMKGGLDNSVKFLNSLKIFTLAVSLGGVASLIEHPASMTHSGVAKEAREAVGIFDGLIRVSVGIENVDDLIHDFDEAFKAVNP